MKTENKKTFTLALNGILGALTVVCLFLASVSPTGRLSLYALSSFFVSVVIIETGIRAGWIFYAGTSMLGLLVVPDKLEVVPYIIFFGIYGVIKFHIEKLRKLPLELILKYAYFNACLLFTILLLRQVFTVNIVSGLPWWLLVIVLQLIFQVYDYVYSLVVDYYRVKLRPRLRV